jgi:MFS family permease
MFRDKNIILYLTYTFFFGLYPIIPIMSLFFLAKNLSFADIGILFAVFSLSGFLFEIPTGYLGDKYGRKLSVMIGLVILAVTAFTWTLLPSLWYFAIFAAIWMLGLAFISGSFEGYIYDYLKSKHQESLYDKLLARSGSIMYAASAIGSIVGAFLFSININYPYYLLSVLFLLCFVITLFMDSDVEVLESEVESQLKIFSGISYVYKHKKILWITVFVALLFGYFDYFRGSVDKPYILSLGMFDVKWIGVFVAFSLAIQSVFISQFEHLKRRIKDSGIILLFWILSSLPLLMMSVFYGYIALLGMLMFYTTESFQETMLNSYTQKHIPSKIRATTLSSMHVYIHSGAAILGILAGNLYTITTMRTGLMISFGYTVAVLIFAYSYKRLHKIYI